MQATIAWDDWRFFLAVARQGSLSAAARELRVNQSTVHRRIAQLERSLDARLFDRMPRGYALSPAGEAIHAEVERLGEELSSLQHRVAGQEREVRGVVRFTTVLELFVRVAPHLRRFRALHPGVQLDVTTSARVFALGRHEADVALRPGRAPTEPDVLARRIAPAPVGVYAAPSYLAGRPRPRGPKDLAGHEAVRFGPGTATDLLGAAETVLQVDAKWAQATACRAGLGVADLPCFLGDADPELERLFVADVSDVDLWLLTHRDLRRTPRVRAFLDFLSEALQTGG